MSWQLFQLSKQSFYGVAVEFSVLPVFLLLPYLRRRHLTGSRSRLGVFHDDNLRPSSQVDESLNDV